MISITLSEVCCLAFPIALHGSLYGLSFSSHYLNMKISQDVAVSHFLCPRISFFWKTYSYDSHLISIDDFPFYIFNLDPCFKLQAHIISCLLEKLNYRSHWLFKMKHKVSKTEFQSPQIIKNVYFTSNEYPK